MSQIVVQGVWTSRASSENLEDFSLLRPDQRRVVQGWVCGCVEGGTLRSGCCSKGFEDILKQ